MVKKLLMVSLGNICRSPIAEAVMKETLKNIELNDEWQVESAGIANTYVGNPPDDRALILLQKHNIEYNETARVIEVEDFNEYDYVFGMDESNIAYLKLLAPHNSKAKLLLLGNYGLPAESKNIENPYYWVGEELFVEAYEKCVIACKAFVNDVLKQ